MVEVKAALSGCFCIYMGKMGKSINLSDAIIDRWSKRLKRIFF
jgi:hypothetical protein